MNQDWNLETYAQRVQGPMRPVTPPRPEGSRGTMGCWGGLPVCEARVSRVVNKQHGSQNSALGKVSDGIWLVLASFVLFWLL